MITLLPHKIGIWGLGVVGTSIARFLHTRGHTLGVLDRKILKPEEQEFLQQHTIHFFSESKRDQFFCEYTTIIPSAGIDLRPYAEQLKHHTLISELDLFDYFNKFLSQTCRVPVRHGFDTTCKACLLTTSGPSGHVECPSTCPPKLPEHRRKLEEPKGKLYAQAGSGPSGHGECFATCPPKLLLERRRKQNVSNHGASEPGDNESKHISCVISNQDQQAMTPIIAITGSLGKTSITQLLSQILSATGARVATGGNIGVGLLDLVDILPTTDYGVIELSSFQLELAQKFAPHLAIITNLFPNHLDRHENLEAYWTAKYNILAHQQLHDLALIHADLFDRVESRNPLSTRAYFSEKRPPQALADNQNTHNQTAFYYFDNTRTIIKEHHTTIQKIASAHDLPDISYPINWLVIIAALDMLNIPLPNLSRVPVEIPDHRLHHVATVNTIDFYNDSKSTVPEATLTALAQLATKNRPIIALIGGMSKGVDRELFIRHIKPRVKIVICFGGEARMLHTYAQQAGITSYAYATLEEAFMQAVALAQPYDQVVLSPAGTSFDLFKNYQERGEAFKNLVLTYNRTHT